MSQQKALQAAGIQPRIPTITWLLLIGTVFGKLVYKSAFPFLSLFLLQQRHLSAGNVGVILGASYLAGVLMSLYAGYLTDRLGQRSVMLTSLILLAASIAMIPVFHSVILIAVTVTLVGTFRNSFETSNQSLVVQMTPVSRQSEVLSIRYVCVNFASGAGPVLGAWLGYSGHASSFVVNGIGYVLYATLLFACTMRLAAHAAPAKKVSADVTPVSMKQAYADILKNRTFLLGIIAACLMTYGYTQIDVTLPLVLIRQSVAASHAFAILLALNTCTIVIFQWPLIKLTARFPKRFTMIGGVVLSSGGYLAFAFAHHLSAYLLGMIILTFGEMLSLTLVVPWLVEVSNPNFQGAYFGAGRLRFLGDFTGSVGGGVILQHFGALQLFGSTAIIVLFAVLSLALARERPLHSRLAFKD